MKGRRRLALVGMFVCGLIFLATQANGGMGASAADLLRATIGAGPTAQIESAYLSVSDSWQQLMFHAGVKKVSAPWKVVPVVTVQPERRGTKTGHVAKHIPVLNALRSAVKPALAGEGVWTASVAPASSRDPFPLIAKAFIRPDPARPYAIATVLRFNLGYLSLHMVAGVTEPGGPLRHVGTGTIPLADQQPGTLLAVMNGGFKYADGRYGMMVNHIVYVPPIANAGTLAITTQGKVLIGEWGQSPALRLSNSDLVSWRQNGSLLINGGVINPLAAQDGAWGTTVLNAAHTWRSAIGLTPGHALLYVAGNGLSVSTLARALKMAGASTGMEMDINPYWVRAFFYGRDPAGHLTSAILRPDMQGASTDYLGRYSRDFLYLTRIPGRSHG